MASTLRKLRARFLKAGFKAHTELYERSDGRLGAWAGLPMLLLTVTGRKTGVAHSTPLVYFMEGDRYVVVGSDGAARNDPQWWKNLQANPEARVRVGREVFTATASLANGDERSRLWERGGTANPAWKRYQTRTARELPVVILTRSSS